MKTEAFNPEKQDGGRVALVPAQADLTIVFEQLDRQLEAFGLEVVLLDNADSDYIWRIDRRAPNAGTFTV